MKNRLSSTVALFLLTTAMAFCQSAFASILPQTYTRLQAAFRVARSNYLAFPDNPKIAVEMARACFDLAEISTNSVGRAALAEQGLEAAGAALRRDPDEAAAHYFQGLNQGELARTKTLGALSLLRHMEKSFLRAAELSPNLENAGPDRSLGLLYLEAPGWPASIGSKRKAREHLERAVNLAPGHPDNLLSLMEAYVRWDDQIALRSAAAQYRKLLPEAREKYSDRKWEQAWVDWDERWGVVQRHVENQ